MLMLLHFTTIYHALKLGDLYFVEKGVFDCSRMNILMYYLRFAMQTS
jgi:hypothetical protein